MAVFFLPHFQARERVQYNFYQHRKFCVLDTEWFLPVTLSSGGSDIEKTDFILFR
jgi:hypothetical protein